MKKLVSALIVAGTALALHAAVHEDDWLKVGLHFMLQFTKTTGSRSRRRTRSFPIPAFR